MLFFLRLPAKLKFLIALLVVLLVSLLIIPTLSNLRQSVVSVTPLPNQQNVDPLTKIVFTFKKPLTPEELRVQFNPPIEFQTELLDNNTRAIITPKYTLTQNQNYIIILLRPLRFESSFTIKSLPIQNQIGQDYNYSREFNTLNEADIEIKTLWEAIIKMRGQLPFSTSTFSISYVIATDTYNVRFLGPNKDTSQKDFLDWLASFNLKPNQVQVNYLN